MSINYVAGFLFRLNQDSCLQVALIEKNKPDWQKGKLNGIGGAIELTDKDPHRAQIREFTEEAGACISNWREFCQLNYRGGTIHFFTSFVDYDVNLVSMTDEKVDWYNVSSILDNTYLIMPNLLWLIPLALDKDRVFAMVQDNS